MSAGWFVCGLWRMGKIRRDNMIGIGLRSGMLGVMVGRLMGWVVLFGSWVFGWLKGAAVLGSGVDSDASEVRRREGARSRKARIMELKRRYFEDYCSDNQYAVSIKEDTTYSALTKDKDHMINTL
ncbi:hypothetical protein Tco_1021810, partial [Tanacetum coccineum]